MSHGDEENGERDLALRSGLTRIRVSGRGRPFVWTHGFTSSMASEDALGTSALLRALPGVSLVRYDARGHGRSAPGRDEAASSWPTLAIDLLELADRLALVRPFAGGASMGVATALHAAVRAPKRFAGLVLVMPPTAWETRRAQADLYRGGAALVDARGVEGYLSAMRAAFRARPMPGFDESMQEKMLDGLRGKTAEELARLLRGAAASDLPRAEELAALDLPSLILPIRDDPGHPLSTAERLATLLRGSELHVLRDVGELASARDRVARFIARVG
jgi:pimeloyl-ACP methyl ester carboxylesterase